MSTAVDGGGLRSLHSMEPGEAARIATILFDRLRAECRALGLVPGQRVVCRAATPAWLILETASRRRVRLERGWARFIEIVEAGPEPGAAEPGTTRPARAG